MKHQSEEDVKAFIAKIVVDGGKYFSELPPEEAKIDLLIKYTTFVIQRTLDWILEKGKE